MDHEIDHMIKDIRRIPKPKKKEKKKEEMNLADLKKNFGNMNLNNSQLEEM